VRTTTILLADYASVREGLLHVLGGGITRLARDPLPGRLDAALALMLRADDLEDLQAAHHMEVSITEAATDEASPPIAKAVIEFGGVRGPVIPGPNLQLPLVVPIQAVPMPRPGFYSITVSLDGAEVGAYEFEVVKGSDQIPEAEGAQRD
jgi:hypothetical protein